MFRKLAISEIIITMCSTKKKVTSDSVIDHHHAMAWDWVGTPWEWHWHLALY